MYRQVFYFYFLRQIIMCTSQLQLINEFLDLSSMSPPYLLFGVTRPSPSPNSNFFFPSSNHYCLKYTKIFRKETTFKVNQSRQLKKEMCSFVMIQKRTKAMTNVRNIRKSMTTSVHSFTFCHLCFLTFQYTSSTGGAFSFPVSIKVIHQFQRKSHP